VNISDVYKTFRHSWADILSIISNRFGRQWQVYIESEGEYRTRAENVGQFYVEIIRAPTCPFRLTIRARSGPEYTMRFTNIAAQIVGARRRATVPHRP